MIRIKNTFVQMFDLVIQLAEGCSITTTSDLGHGIALCYDPTL